METEDDVLSVRASGLGELYAKVPDAITCRPLLPERAFLLGIMGITRDPDLMPG